MKVKFKKLHSDAKIPSYAKKGDAGLNLIAITVDSKFKVDKVPGKPTQTQQTFKYLEFGTGLAVEIPKGHVGLIFPRSSISETSMSLSNSAGVIDSGYRGEIKFRFRNTDNKLDTYKVGDKIGQLLIMALPVLEVEEATDLSISERGTDGFGSSGK
jgi:dUTP pyrophosphatase